MCMHFPTKRQPLMRELCADFTVCTQLMIRNLIGFVQKLTFLLTKNNSEREKASIYCDMICVESIWRDCSPVRLPCQSCHHTGINKMAVIRGSVDAVAMI